MSAVISFNTQPPEGGCRSAHTLSRFLILVSTHSRPKAAAFLSSVRHRSLHGFQHTAARRRLLHENVIVDLYDMVSTHSRPKAAALAATCCKLTRLVSTHSRPKAAASPFVGCATAMTGFNTQPPEGGCLMTNVLYSAARYVSTHSRPKAAAEHERIGILRTACFNTQPPEGGCVVGCECGFR